MRSAAAPVLLAIAYLCTSAPVRGATVVYEGGSGSLQSSLWYGNTSHGANQPVSASSATLADVGAITFDGMDWVGGYVNLPGPHINPDATDSFTLNIFTDSAGLPGTLVSSIGLGAANRSATGQMLGQASEYSYSAAFSPVALSSGEYFFALTNNYAGTGSWGWESTANGPLLGGASEQTLGGAWTSFPTENLAFDLTTASVVPIPGSVWLLISGLCLLLACGRGAGVFRREHVAADPTAIRAA